MRLPCTVQVHNRTSCSLDINMRKKPQQAVLTIGKNSKDNSAQILLQTVQNKPGVKYKIKNNIDKVFTRFISDGKATIRLLEPHHDLIIHGNAIQLKSFLHMLKAIISEKIRPQHISNIESKIMPVIPKTKIVIKKNSEYPVLQGFPRTTEQLNLCGLTRKHFDERILQLQSLRMLNLSNNLLHCLPTELGRLPHLQELFLGKNCLGQSAQFKWDWLYQAPIRQNLRLLNIEKNSLRNLPVLIGKLRNLINLNVSCNRLIYIPQSIGQLSSLKYLNVSQNEMRYLPRTIKKLKLTSLDISSNPFTPNHELDFQLKILSLTEYSARCVLKHRIKYDTKYQIPVTLVSYLDNANYCDLCGKAIFDSFVRRFITENINSLSVSICQRTRYEVIYETYFCSLTCNDHCLWNRLPHRFPV